MLEMSEKDLKQNETIIYCRQNEMKLMTFNIYQPVRD